MNSFSSSSSASYNIPNRDKPVDKERCQSIYFNTLELLKKAQIKSDSHISNTDYLREFFQTQRCDEFSDLSSLRKSTVDLFYQVIPQGDYKHDFRNVVDINSRMSEEEMIAVTQVVQHYSKYHQKHLYLALTPFNKTRYYFRALERCQNQWRKH